MPESFVEHEDDIQGNRKLDHNTFVEMYLQNVGKLHGISAVFGDCVAERIAVLTTSSTLSRRFAPEQGT